ncbi:MAG: DNA/RNA non-specific endonuclease [Ruminococcus sp.]|nr:DNA/RNA non-specific endonuclease [Ruminococcus sp.]
MKKLFLALLIVCAALLTSCAELVPEPNTAQISSSLPAYDGEPSVSVRNGVPDFSDSDKHSKVSFEKYSPLDSLGRCGTAYANISKELMPTKKRGDISSVKPTGWVQKSYAFVEDGMLYNRCHLIAHMLAGEDDNERNLITGTRYMNVEGMLPYETRVYDYVKVTGNHVLYRVTPYFKGDNLVADGVQMEAWSVEDVGREICFNVFCYNVQPGVLITYANGKSKSDGTIRVYGKSKVSGNKSKTQSASKKTPTYILNTNNMKFHKPGCNSVEKIDPYNKKKYYGKRKDLIKAGYEPCGMCKP